MRVPSLRVPVLVACTLAATSLATAATATAQDRRREESDRARRERLQREREEREDREYRARLRQREQQRAQQGRAEEARERAERAERERRAREALAERRRRDDWRDAYRPRVSLGGGFDVRSFGGDDNRYLVQGGVDFRSRTGLGVRPELLFAWTDPTANLPIVPCPACGGQPLINLAPTRGRSRMIGVAVSGTYTLARSSPVRPYLMSGLGVFSTRTPLVVVMIVGTTPAGTPSYQADVGWRNDVDVGLTAGAGLEFDLGPARLFTEFRYLLTDQPRLRGFGGMMPLTAGLRL